MAEKNSRSREDAPPQTVTAFLEAAVGLAHARLFRDNPFRLLGLPALAMGRDVAKRADQLRLGAELGTASYDWSFAPEPPPNADHLRSATHGLKEPRQRLLAEFFWFWPQSYPTDSPDTSLDHLAHGRTAEAVAEWAALPSSENPAALHNLAVYHHLMAIEQEQLQPPLPDEDIAAWWRAALRYWQVVVEADEIWRRLEQRVTDLADAQLPVAVVQPFRKQLLDLVSAVNSSIAVSAAEEGDHRTAGRHVAMLGELHADAQDVRKVLERGAAPLVQRIDLRIAECQRAIAGDPASGIAAAKFLIEHCAEEIQILNTLCGRESEFLVEVCNRLAATTLDAVVGFQRGSSDNAACLPVLVYLQTVPVGPEAKRRLRDTFEVIYANAASHQEEKHDGSELDDGREPLYARTYRVVAEKIIPGIEAFGLGDTVRRECCDRVADLLRRVARGACEERDDINFALHAYRTILALPSDPPEFARREAERDHFHQQFLQRMQKELRLPLPEHVLEITVRGLRWDDQVIGFNDVVAFRHGRKSDADANTAPFVVAWRTADSEVTLDSTNVFVDLGSAEAVYARIIEALYFFVLPSLVERLVASIRSGTTVEIGNSPLSKDGITLTAGTRFWRKEEEVPYSQLEHRLDGDAVVVANVKNPRIQRRYPILDTWNAPALGYVIAALAQS